jgi:hypothetical protein
VPNSRFPVETDGALAVAPMAVAAIRFHEVRQPEVEPATDLGPFVQRRPAGIEIAMHTANLFPDLGRAATVDRLASTLAVLQAKLDRALPTTIGPLPDTAISTPTTLGHELLLSLRSCDGGRAGRADRLGAFPIASRSSAISARRAWTSPARSRRPAVGPAAARRRSRYAAFR